MRDHITLERSITAAPDIIYTLLMDPEKYIDINRSNLLLRHNGHVMLPDGGYEIDWEYTAFGIRIPVLSTVRPVMPNEELRVHSTGPVEVQMTLRLEAQGDKTRVVVMLDYTITGRTRLTAISAPFARNQVIYSMETFLQRLDDAVLRSFQQPDQEA